MTIRAQSESAGPPLRRGGGVSAWRQIADALEAEIATGILPPGAQLPAEAILAARFGVNRHTLRRAIGVLAAAGLVRATQGKGTFVEARPLAYPIGPRTRFTEIASQVGREAGAELLAAVTLPADAFVAGALGIDAGSPVLRLDTVRSTDGTPLSLGHSSFPLPRFAGLAEAFAATLSIAQALKLCGVADFRRAESRIGARIATGEESRLLDLAPGRILFVVHSIDVDEAGTPVRAGHSLFAADRVEIVVEEKPA